MINIKNKTELFKQEIYNLVQNEYTILGEYKNRRIPIAFIHSNKCNHVFMMKPENFLKGSRCPKCSKGQKLSHAEFLRRVRNTLGKDYIILSEYKNTRTNVKVRHVCGHEYETLAKNLLAGSKCGHCYSKNKPKSTEKFKQEMKLLVGDEYTLLNTYKKSDVPIKLKHTCGKIIEMTPNAFIKGKRCDCNKNNITKHDKFIKDVENILGTDYKILNKFKSMKNEVRVKHSCGYIYKIKAEDLIKGKTCTKCKSKNSETTVIKPNKKTKWTTKKYKEEILKLYQYEYTVLGEYKNQKTKIKVKHEFCGKEYDVAPLSLLKGHKCMECYGLKRKTHEEYINQVKEIHKDEYEVLDKYINSKIKIQIKHKNCDTISLINPSQLLNGKPCTHCNNSKGELKIKYLLSERNIEFKSEYKIKYSQRTFGLVDFVILKQDKIIAGIEFDGLQHFRPIEYFGGLKAFKKQIISDKKKNNWFIQNNIPLLRIPYWDYDNIEHKLNSFLNNLYNINS